MKYLTRRTDAATLITAAEIALLCEDEILSKSLSEEAIIAALTQSEYDLARAMIVRFPYLKVHLRYILFFFYFYFKDLASSETRLYFSTKKYVYWFSKNFKK